MEYSASPISEMVLTFLMQHLVASWASDGTGIVIADACSCSMLMVLVRQLNRAS